MKMALKNHAISKPSTVLAKPNIQDKKNIQQIKKKNKKTARTRRHRGYHWEDTIVKRFNGLKEWKAFRLGSPSTGLPDILAVSNKNNAIITMEAKSGTTDYLPVPADQILRCLKWVDTFEIYNTRKVIFAFKFLSKKWIGPNEYETRELREFFKIWDESLKITDCVCTYEGITYALENGKRSKLFLEDYAMPFNSRHQIFSKP
ncbi:MAG TPA: resolvase [Nitrosopumilaceae archaeon]|nr:resolvase [Nitrosopumilaceae archaeon]